MPSNTAEPHLARTESAYLDRPIEADLGLLILRAFLGVIFMVHGSQKLFGWFGGYGLKGTAGFFESVGFTPGKPLVVLSGLVECGGGALLVAGLGVSLVGAGIIADMAGAALAMHTAGGGKFFASQGGYEFELTLLVAALALTLIGGGRLSLDHGRAWARPRVRLMLASAGVLGALIVALMK